MQIKLIYENFVNSTIGDKSSQIEATHVPSTVLSGCFSKCLSMVLRMSNSIGIIIAINRNSKMRLLNWYRWATITPIWIRLLIEILGNIYSCFSTLTQLLLFRFAIFFSKAEQFYPSFSLRINSFILVFLQWYYKTFRWVAIWSRKVYFLLVLLYSLFISFTLFNSYPHNLYFKQTSN